MNKLLATALTASLALSMATPAFAESSSSASSSSSSESSSMMKKESSMMKRDMKMNGANVDAACMQSAIDKRDTAIIASVDSYAATVKTALQTRKDALKAAWAIQDKTARNTAIKAAWASYQGTWKKASTAVRAARKAAWSAFKTDAKNCKQAGADASGESMDNNL